MFACHSQTLLMRLFHRRTALKTQSVTRWTKQTKKATAKRVAKPQIIFTCRANRITGSNPPGLKETPRSKTINQKIPSLQALTGTNQSISLGTVPGSALKRREAVKATQNKHRPSHESTVDPLKRPCRRKQPLSRLLFSGPITRSERWAQNRSPNLQTSLCPALKGRRKSRPFSYPVQWRAAGWFIEILHIHPSLSIAVYISDLFNYIISVQPETVVWNANKQTRQWSELLFCSQSVRQPYFPPCAARVLFCGPRENESRSRARPREPGTVSSTDAGAVWWPLECFPLFIAWPGPTAHRVCVCVFVVALVRSLGCLGNWGPGYSSSPANSPDGHSFIRGSHPARWEPLELTWCFLLFSTFFCFALCICVYQWLYCHTGMTKLWNQKPSHQWKFGPRQPTYTLPKACVSVHACVCYIVCGVWKVCFVQTGTHKHSKTQQDMKCLTVIDAIALTQTHTHTYTLKHTESMQIVHHKARWKWERNNNSKKNK